MQTKGKFDPNSPEIKAYLERIRAPICREGTMVAFPMCLPGMTTPITLDESRITALDINSEGHVYGGTSGRQAHLFGAAFHGLTGIVLDAGAVARVARAPSRLLRRPSRTIAFVNGSRGGRAVAVPHIELARRLDPGVGSCGASPEGTRRVCPGRAGGSRRRCARPAKMPSLA